jgi:DNA repair protein SbcD/Mre11
MRFVHAADLHLDSPLGGLERYEGAPVERIRGATRRALENLVDLCLAEEVDFLLIAGDLFDGDWRDYATGLFLSAQMSRLREGGVRVFLVRGNHDAQSKITRRLDWPENVVELATGRPETVRDERLGLAVHGQGFASASVTEDLAAAYPDAERGLFNVGLLHTALSGRPGHASYAPCTVETLRGKGYDYWALGHVHLREVVCEDPFIVFPGNLQGRHARETGDKGATLVTVREGRVASLEHRPLDVVRWERLCVDAADATCGEDVVEQVRGDLERLAARGDVPLWAVRVEVVGASRAHGALQAEGERWANAIRACALDVGDVWIERVRLRTLPAFDAEAAASRDDAVGALLRALRDIREDDEQLLPLGAELEALTRRLPPEAREGEDGVRVQDPDYMRDAVEDVERVVLGRLLEGRGGDEP